MAEDNGTAPARNTTNAPVEEQVPPYTGPGFITDNPELAGLSQAQLYELNQGLLDESVPQRPFIDEIVPMSVLRAEYENGSASFVAQIDFLISKGFTGVRRTRGDGDCFYRSLAFAYVERIMNLPDQDLAVATALSTLETSIPVLEAAGFQKLVFEDFYEAFTDVIQQIVRPAADGTRLTSAKLLEAFQNPEVSNSIVVYLRLLTSAQIRADPDTYSGFLFHPDLGEPMAPREFCENFVEATGKEADHVQMTALSRALRVSFNVAYLDGHSKEGKVDFVEFHDSLEEDSEPLILLYRPGHYDILTKQTANTQWTDISRTQS